MKMRRNRLAALATLAVLATLCTSAAAAVTEPNGVVVPGQPSVSSEVPLWDFFTAQGETFDTVADASAEPGTFSPRCDFEATLVQSESQAAAGLAWYNVPDDPEAAPDAIYELFTPPYLDNTAIGTTVSSADILTNPNYAGGLIGFALTKDGLGAIYYSEYRRNVYCSRCDMPDYWKMMLAYSSTISPNTYYLAFEDWEGANDMQWFGNDGDFNDKVFRVSGITCMGGGEACDTGKLGHCAAGLTECQPGGTLGCRQQILESDEKCDNVDNDCDGEVDEGDLCPPGEVCRQGKCEPPCGGGEFRCTTDLVCTAEGLCVEPACVDVVCDAGEVCHGGNCVGACDDVVCPLGQVCQIGRCVDPCRDITCDAGTVCENGVCVEPCTCRPCSAGLACATNGSCVEPGCEDITCDAGSVCVAGDCVDACRDAVCPGGASCEAGSCDEPLGAGGDTGTSDSGATGNVISNGGTIALPGSSASATDNGNSTNGSGGLGLEGRPAQQNGGCACRANPGKQSHLLWLWLIAGIWMTRRRRESR